MLAYVILGNSFEKAKRNHVPLRHSLKVFVLWPLPKPREQKPEAHAMQPEVETRPNS